MKNPIRLLLFGVLVFGLAGCSDGTGSESDAGQDAFDAADGGGDAGGDQPSDAGGDELPDAGGDDAGDAGDGDQAVAECQNGIAEGDEACDGDDLRDETCAGLGLPAGTLGCKPDCTFDLADCVLCGDGVCTAGETASGCPAECGVLDICAGVSHTCAVRNDNSVVCWGAGAGHRLGGTGDVNRPVRVPGVSDAVQVACGEAHTCARLSTNQVICWGRNGFGEAGSGETSREVFPPQTVPNLDPSALIAAGAHHTCSASTQGNVDCWGRGDFGNLGDGNFSLRNPGPVRITGISGATDLHAGRHHTCSLEDSTLKCWGFNDQGQLGTGDAIWSAAPYTISTRAIGLGTGESHTCSTFNNPSMPPQFSGFFCWGSNGYGQLGAPPNPAWLGPQRVTGTFSLYIEGGRAFTCLVDMLVPGVPMCWGGNDFGQLGDGTQESRYTVGAVTGISTAQAISAGREHVCVLLDDQTVRCWGRNNHGQLGDGSGQGFSTTPVQPVGL